MIRPKAKHWVDRRKRPSHAVLIFKCTRDTCNGAVTMNSTVLEKAELGELDSCWTARDGKWVDQCSSSGLQCAEGSSGPICGSCKEGYIYKSSSRVCEKCVESMTFAAVALSVAAVVSLMALAIFGGYLELPMCVQESWLFGALSTLDSGTFRICWSTYQIVQSITWNIEIALPKPFSTMENFLSLFSFDFLSPDCLTGGSSHSKSVYIWTALPVVLTVLNWVLYKLRRVLRNAEIGAPGGNVQAQILQATSRRNLKRTHIYWFLMGTYLCVPSVTRAQFQAIDCLKLPGAGRYLRVDTSVNCETDAFTQFAVLDSIFLVVYISIPILWLSLLWRKRVRLMSYANFASFRVQSNNMEKKNIDGLWTYSFLFSAYKPTCVNALVWLY